MNAVVVRNVKIGEGIPKICVPIAEARKEDIIREAENFSSIPGDIVEWRADWFEHAFDTEKVLDVLKDLRAVLKETPILFTFRTLKEGGEKAVKLCVYADLIKAAVRCGYADLVDVEVFAGDAAVREIVDTAHAYGVKVVASNHDFEKTPDKDEMIRRLCKMQELGADITKIAVMPQSKKDVLTLLAATEEMYREHADRPMITMSMSGTGALSRLCGEVFGSAVTFGAAGKASAPGQMEVKELAQVLSLLHKSL